MQTTNSSSIRKQTERVTIFCFRKMSGQYGPIILLLTLRRRIEEISLDRNQSRQMLFFFLNIYSSPPNRKWSYFLWNKWNSISFLVSLYIKIHFYLTLKKNSAVNCQVILQLAKWKKNKIAYVIKKSLFFSKNPLKKSLFRMGFILMESTIYPNYVPYSLLFQKSVTNYFLLFYLLLETLTKRAEIIFFLLVLSH